MKNLIAYLAVLLAAAALHAQPLLVENFDYADGELYTTSYGIWSVYNNEERVPYAATVGQTVVIDYTLGTSFAGEYQARAPGPEQKVIMNASFYLTVTEPVLEVEGTSFFGLAEIDCRSCYRGRVFMKKGEGENTYRLGLASQVSTVVTPEGWINTLWYAQDLKLNETYLVRTYWNNDELVARLYIDSNEFDQPAVEVIGGTARRNAMRRFGLIMDSDYPLGRLVIDNVRMAEGWEDANQPILAKDPFTVPFRTYEDPVVGHYEEVGGGWALWYPTMTDGTSGFLYMPLRGNSGYGWHFHGTQGWIYLIEGNMQDGLWAYGMGGLEWVYTRADFAGQFYHYKDGIYRYWLQPR